HLVGVDGFAAGRLFQGGKEVAVIAVAQLQQNLSVGGGALSAGPGNTDVIGFAQVNHGDHIQDGSAPAAMYLGATRNLCNISDRNTDPLATLGEDHFVFAYFRPNFALLQGQTTARVNHWIYGIDLLCKGCIRQSY